MNGMEMPHLWLIRIRLETCGMERHLRESPGLPHVGTVEQADASGKQPAARAEGRR